MPGEVPDRLRREAGVHEPLDRGMAEGVRARAGHLDAGAQQIAPGAARNGVSLTGAIARKKTCRSVLPGRPCWR